MWNKMANIKRGLCTVGLGLAIAAGSSGCVAHARGEIVYDYPVAYVDTAPSRIEYYPRTVYHGRPAYLVDGRWYYHTDRSWVYFREEPTELREYRTRRLPAYAAGPPGRTYYAESRSANRAEIRRNEQRRAAEQRAEMRRNEERRAAEHRAEVRRNEERRAADHRAEVRRIEERQAAERRAEQDRRVAEQRRAHDSKKKERPRRDPRDRHDDDRNGRDHDRRND
jgi:hypothetical protein